MAYRSPWTLKQRRAFARRMRDFRRARRWTPKELAWKMGVGERTVRSAERCEYAPHTGTLLRFGRLVRGESVEEVNPWRGV
jgi:ribosome-binding protein aMBF1 (putative translation factor)